jgi:hypothetical protein
MAMEERSMIKMLFMGNSGGKSRKERHRKRRLVDLEITDRLCGDQKMETEGFCEWGMGCMGHNAPWDIS